MCGIVGFVSNNAWKTTLPPDVTNHLLPMFMDQEDSPNWIEIQNAMEKLETSFDHLQSFWLIADVCAKKQTAEKLNILVGTLSTLRQSLLDQTALGGATPPLMALAEKLHDYSWQIQHEILSVVDDLTKLTPSAPMALTRPALFTAWSLTRVLAAIDRIEVRGRDSLGISIIFTVPSHWTAPESMRNDWNTRLSSNESRSGRISISQTPDHRKTVRFIYKTAKLVGRLGDNSAQIRQQLREDRLFWSLASQIDSLNILAHTRWASNGIINLSNCHPLNGVFWQDRSSTSFSPGDRAAFVLNGDVDNHVSLAEHLFIDQGVRIDSAVTTDAKIIPVLYSIPHSHDTTFQRFAGALRQCQGSMSVAMHDLTAPNTICVAQKGSGQALYAGQTMDGWMIASEVYGLASVCRQCLTMNTGNPQGVALRLVEDHAADQAENSSPTPPLGIHLADGSHWSAPSEMIQIFTRDIDRANFDYHIEKEISDAPESVKKTLHGKYLKIDNTITWILDGMGRGADFLHRLQSGHIHRIVCIGQGSAAIAAMGVAYLIQQALRGTRIEVESSKSSELFGFSDNLDLNNTIIVAISQSGTTTDTNRIVDIARERGAWIHAIVNRRNAALVDKSHSYTYTSTGRDIEVSVASTKAFYAQITAGKLLALFLGETLSDIHSSDLFEEIEELEKLPDKLTEVLKSRQNIANIASNLAAKSQNWAIVGNGSNRIAAEEIRIKLSELCYKSIPCDITEDKKHIDLSTEPLTLVIANDLPQSITQDTVKEVSIFQAHNGQPIVFCQQNETRFHAVAEWIIPLPQIAGGLGFVIATMAGHLFAVATAKAIDHAATPFRTIRAHISSLMEERNACSMTDLKHSLLEASAYLEKGSADSVLNASLVARFSRYVRWISAESDSLHPNDARLEDFTRLINDFIDTLTRPIDTIRHQAKTITVGISRTIESSSLDLASAISSTESLSRFHTASSPKKACTSEIICTPQQSE